MEEAILKKLSDFMSSHEWLAANMNSLITRYPDQWIAVSGGDVVASDADLDSLLSKIEDPAHTCVEFITREPLEMVL